MKRYHLTTFGCQMNEHDSERMKGMLESLGYAEAGAAEEADVILFNTCSIREKADSRFIAHLHQAKGLKRQNPERIIGVGGCWAQSVKDEVFARFPFVDVAFGPGQVNKLAEFLTSDSISAQGYFEFEGFTGHLPAKRGREFQAWVQISVGCNCRCSYCIVPSTRGREVSRPAGELIEEVRRLAADGNDKDTGLRNLPFRDFEHNRVWLELVLIAHDLIAWTQRLLLTGELANAEPKRLRYRLLHVAGRLAFHARSARLRLQASWPWAGELAAAIPGKNPLRDAKACRSRFGFASGLV